MKHLDRAGLLDVDVPPEDEVESLRARALQQSLPFLEATALAAVQPRRHHRRVAVADGFSLHADTFVHEADRQGLERLCRYGARGPLAEERLSRADDGRYVYRLRRPSPSGATALALTAGELVRRLAALLPPRRRHLTRFHGVFAPNARLRPVVTRLGRPAEESPPPPRPCPHGASPPAPAEGALVPDSPAPRRPPVDWATLLRHTFNLDVLACPCGGRRRLLAAVTSPSVAKEGAAGVGTPPAPRPAAHRASTAPAGPRRLTRLPRHPQLRAPARREASARASTSTGSRSRLSTAPRRASCPWGAASARLRPRQEGGLFLLSLDGNSVAYGVRRSQSELWLVTGLK